MDNRKKVAILGCTGSVGMQTIDVISKMSDEFEIYSLTAHSRAKEAALLAAKYEPKLLCITGKCDKNTVFLRKQWIDFPNFPRYSYVRMEKWRKNDGKKENLRRKKRK